MLTAYTAFERYSVLKVICRGVQGYGRGGEVAQWVEVPAFKLVSLSSSPGPLMVEGES